MSPSRWEAATKLTRRLLLPTPESPMRRILKEHSWPPLLPAPGDPIPPQIPPDSVARRARNAGQSGGTREAGGGIEGAGVARGAGSGAVEGGSEGDSYPADWCVVVLALTEGERSSEGGRRG